VCTLAASKGNDSVPKRFVEAIVKSVVSVADDESNIKENLVKIFRTNAERIYRI